VRQPFAALGPLDFGTYALLVVPLIAMDEEPALARITVTFNDAASFEHHYVVNTDRIDASQVPDLLRRAGQFLLSEAETAGRWLSQMAEGGPLVIGQGSSSEAGLHRRDASDEPPGVDGQ
jgi:hypothetical protein